MLWRMAKTIYCLHVDAPKKSIVKKPGRMDVDVPVPSLGHTLIVSTVYLRLIEYTPIGSAKFVHARSSERKLGQVS